MPMPLRTMRRDPSPSTPEHMTTCDQAREFRAVQKGANTLRQQISAPVQLISMHTATGLHLQGRFLSAGV